MKAFPLALLLGFSLCDASPADSISDEVVSDRAYFCVEQLLPVLFDDLKEGMPADLYGSDPAFRRFVRWKKAGDWSSLNSLQRKAITESYFVAQMRKYLPEHLTIAERQSLGDALRYHGIALGDPNPRKTLEAISARNAARIMKVKYISTPEMRNAEQIVAALSPIFRHNSVYEGELSGPLMSAHQIYRIAKKTTLNTNGEFTKNFMGQVDQVFAFAELSASHTGKSTKYGNFSFNLEADYVGRHGWISAYVMKPKDLYDLGRRAFPDLVANLPTRVRPSSFIREALEEGGSRGLKAWTTLRNHLHQFDFTVEDYVKWVKHELLIELQSLQKINPERFAEYLEILQGRESQAFMDHLILTNEKTAFHGQYTPIGYILDQLVFEKRGLPRMFETKVPVAVPLPYVEVVR